MTPDLARAVITGTAIATVYALAALVARGDRVLMYTDGITEAGGAGDELFGVDRLRAIVAESRGGAERLASMVIEAATTFRRRGDLALDDDCTLVAIEAR
ncbi:MAG TPA: SpoIIE family protein phosphatase [Vicinamibacterales bacterium]|nr:SpoIIE family protein phosphatase [Vicinamibacterales bacterium]